ncbi:MAG: hypothetical protein WB664_02810, partial [Nitrososphaeraceae archaeon]
LDKGIPILILNYKDLICCLSSFTEPTYKHNILLSCPVPNASNDYGIFQFVAIKSLFTSIR